MATSTQPYAKPRPLRPQQTASREFIRQATLRVGEPSIRVSRRERWFSIPDDGTPERAYRANRTTGQCAPHAIPGLSRGQGLGETSRTGRLTRGR